MTPQDRLKKWREKEKSKKETLVFVIIVFLGGLQFIIGILGAFLVGLGILVACLHLKDYLWPMMRALDGRPISLRRDVEFITKHVLIARGWSGDDDGIASLYFDQKSDASIKSLLINGEMVNDLNDTEKAIFSLTLLKHKTWRTRGLRHLTYHVDNIKSLSAHQRFDSVKVLNDFLAGKIKASFP